LGAGFAVVDLLVRPVWSRLQILLRRRSENKLVDKERVKEWSSPLSGRWGGDRDEGCYRLVAERKVL